MKKIIEFLVVVTAVWGCALSTYIYITSEMSKKPIIHTAIKITGKGEEPAEEGKAKDVRIKVYVSNTGKDSIEISALVNIQIINSKYRWQKEISARLSDESGEDNKNNKLPALLKPGEEIVFNTPYYKFEDWFNPHNQYVVVLSSENKLLASYTPAPKKADDIEKSFNIMNGITKRHFSTYETPISIASEVSDF